VVISIGGTGLPPARAHRAIRGSSRNPEKDIAVANV
jgi:hypothetical protein